MTERYPAPADLDPAEYPADHPLRTRTIDRFWIEVFEGDQPDTFYAVITTADRTGGVDFEEEGPAFERAALEPIGRTVGRAMMWGVRRAHELVEYEIEFEEMNLPTDRSGRLV